MKKKTSLFRDVFIIKYSDKNLEEWKKLFEKFGSFRAVSKYLRDNNNGRGPSVPTINRRLKIKFSQQGRDFDSWVDQYSVQYSDAEVDKWKKYYERLGSFRAVSKYICKRNNEQGPSASTIKRRLKIKFSQEGRNFDSWVKQYSIGYSDDDVHNWKLLYERLGGFRAVSRYIREISNGKGPNPSVVHYRLKNLLQKDRKNFEDWVEEFSRVDEILEQQNYTQEEMDKWEILYEQLGSFSAVSRYLSYQGTKSAVTSTIIKNLRKKFRKEGRNFSEWVNNFFSPDSNIASNIGRFIHNVLELIFIRFCLKNNLDAFFEVSQIGSDSIFDNVIINPMEQFKLFIIDYTIASDLRKILEKCFRGYQGQEKKLIIVVFLSDKIITLPNNRNIPNNENIEIFNAHEFATFMGYKGNSLYQFEYFRYLGRKAFYDTEAYRELEKLSKIAKNNLNRLAKKYSLCQNDFKNYILSNGLEYLFK